MSFSDEDDLQLMHRLSAGEDLALNEIMLRWRERVCAFLLRMVGDHATATDLAQETFVRLYTSRKSYKPSAAFSTYLFHIVANLARSHARWKSRHPTVPMENECGVLVHDPVDPSPAPDAAAELAEKAHFVNQAIARLPAEMREALLLFTVEQMSHAEIATVQRCSAKAVEVRVYRARQMLREMLDAGRM
ncbi:sigma-70 family RNA polymerase sigma factor [Prosthecobacter sp.]|uniref:RNA polymerase sigma factor n=1 Tax=Prosthecobacter sp. TaxID=1965333 RepID=UPI0024876DEA|nr:sigma-70 family RNA polymerase sigma factor [Prosthecobacter sp.]MDI1314867.1 sigma-70 family RNA polymerase sigma factor [Prosthecobacter sp.]